MSGSTGAPGGTTYRGAVDRPFTRAMRADGRPATLDDYVAASGCEGLRRALDDLKAPEVTTMVTESGLRGRGGAGYSTGRKWSTMPLGPAAPHPSTSSATATRWSRAASRIASSWSGTRTCSSRACCWLAATEADAGYIFVRAQYDASLAALGRAIGEARERGYLGERVLGSRFSFDIELHESIGRYICGEASAMLNALESQRPNPRARPPHMTGAGLFSRPTVVNNVETYMAVPSIVAHGPDWWKGLSVTDEGGTKICGVAAASPVPVATSCLWERRSGSSSRCTPAACCPGTRSAPSARAAPPPPSSPRRTLTCHSASAPWARCRAASGPARWWCSTARSATRAASATSRT